MLLRAHRRTPQGAEGQGRRRLALIALAALAVAGLLAGLATLPASAAATSEAEGHYGFLSLLPALVAIAVAIWLKEVVVALAAGVFVGALISTSGNPFAALARSMDTFVVPALADPDHAAILIFSGLLIAMVAVISRCGGTLGVIELVAPMATTGIRGQLATWTMGVLIFFDDYANTLIVGPTMRPITDRLRISREKLAYIVDSTAAPVVSLVPLSTWIGFELGLVQDAFATLALEQSAFGAIVASIPYRFYQFFALGLGLMVAVTGLDFGAMRQAELRARSGEVLGPGQVPLADLGASDLEPPDDAPHRARNALVPIVTVVFVTLLGLWTTGSASLGETSASGLERLRLVFSGADSYRALQWAGASGLLAAIALASSQRILTLVEATKAAIDGLRVAFIAFVVLILSWALGAVCKALGAAGFLLQVTEGALAPQLLPALTFVVAAAIAFATGSSWGTLAILTPLIVPLAHGLSVSAGLAPGSAGFQGVLLASIASVLSGSVWGDHCSPISDTTILSSMAAGCDHLAHVRTQLPYAMLGGSTAVLLGILPASAGVPPLLCIGVGLLAIYAVLRLLGERTRRRSAAAGAGSG
ncbi:MAG: Na+/H+ antiporter NhaC family protein [Acidobacteria bacterium]|nr:MAG: Na+/H+ antiporter NhaC family protein [Acidobacteriota bacterium]REK08701.1 MAG: Na+/H+ antiporter NhaC family protein [Acidobacteriota bacterium]